MRGEKEGKEGKREGSEKKGRIKKRGRERVS